MKFEEIFKQPGLYRADSFRKGTGFEVTKDGVLMQVSYETASANFPHREPAIMARSLFDKDYRLVYNRKELFD